MHNIDEQIGVYWPLHFPEDCVLLADKIYPSYAIYNATNTSKTRKESAEASIYLIVNCSKTYIENKSDYDKMGRISATSYTA
jgi:hypothetical protein